MHEPHHTEPNLSAELSTLTLTTRERRVIRRALTMSAAMLDALEDYLSAASMVELADRVLTASELGDG